jgi:hypothetical protein
MVVPPFEHRRRAAALILRSGHFDRCHAEALAAWLLAPDTPQEPVAAPPAGDRPIRVAESLDFEIAAPAGWQRVPWHPALVALWRAYHGELVPAADHVPGGHDAAHRLRSQLGRLAVEHPALRPLVGRRAIAFRRGVLRLRANRVRT